MKNLNGRNKKKIKRIYKIGIIAFSIVFVIGIVIGFGFIYVNPQLSEPLDCDGFYSQWMSYVNDDALIKEIALPGSHDSGTNDMIAQAMTQGHDYDDQLNGGVRYFDTRVTDKSGELVMFHGPIKGQSFDNVLNDIAVFVENNPSEFIILNFTHLGDDVHSEVIETIKENLDLSKVMKKSDFSELQTVSMGDIRDKGINIVILWLNNDEANTEDFLYSEDCMVSQYESSIHTSSDEVLIDYFATYYENYDSDKLFLLQAQKTAPNYIEKPSVNEMNFKPKVNEYIKNIKNDPDLLEKTNIIMRDFIVSDMENINLILDINISKNIIKTDCIDYYSSMVAV
jgi:hypothetical protein